MDMDPQITEETALTVRFPNPHQPPVAAGQELVGHNTIIKRLSVNLSENRSITTAFCHDSFLRIIAFPSIF